MYCGMPMLQANIKIIKGGAYGFQKKKYILGLHNFSGEIPIISNLKLNNLVFSESLSGIWNLGYQKVSVFLITKFRFRAAFKETWGEIFET